MVWSDEGDGQACDACKRDSVARTLSLALAVVRGGGGDVHLNVRHDLYLGRHWGRAVESGERYGEGRDKEVMVEKSKGFTDASSPAGSGRRMDAACSWKPVLFLPPNHHPNLRCRLDLLSLGVLVSPSQTFVLQPRHHVEHLLPTAASTSPRGRQRGHGGRPGGRLKVKSDREHPMGRAIVSLYSGPELGFQKQKAHRLMPVRRVSSFPFTAGPRQSTTSRVRRMSSPSSRRRSAQRM